MLPFDIDINFWVIFGLLGQSMFFMRFIIQWIASEKNGESVIPVAFWYFSIIGGVMILIYSLHIKDPVFILGQGLALVIYVRNLVLIRRKNTLDKSRTTPNP